MGNLIKLIFVVSVFTSLFYLINTNVPPIGWLALGILGVGYSIFSFLDTLLGEQDEQKALSWASDDEPQKSKSPLLEFSRPLVHRFCLQWASKVKNKRYRKKVTQKIASAGLERVLNVDEFIGLQFFLGIFVPVILTILIFTLQLDISIIFPVLLIFLGAWYPHAYVNNEKKSRTIDVIADLPFYIDLLALSTEAGLDFISSIQRVVEKAPPENILGNEFGNVLRDLKLGQSRADALKGLSNRLDISEITSFIAVLVDADATGASIATVLKQQSIQMRVERFTRAEKAGARASQAILIPLMLFILPAVFIMVFGPVVLQFMGQK